MGSRARVLFFADQFAVTVDDFARSSAIDSLPCKEWSLDNDALNVSDSLSFTVDNADGRNSGKINPGALIAFDLAEDSVAGGQWVRQFTGRAIRVNYSSEEGSGSNILVSAMDLGWHLTVCHAKPLTRTSGIALGELVRRLVDPSWGFPATVTSSGPVQGNALNRHLMQGRTGAVRQFVAPLQRSALPYIQVEPGQAPWQILSEYFAREGLLLNVGADGGLIMFRPDYSQDVPYSGIEYHPANTTDARRNNVRGRVSLDEDVTGIYSESQVWWTSVKPTIVQSNEKRVNPNAMYRRHIFQLEENPLPYFRRSCVSDSEAINDEMARLRAIWHLQMDLFNAWSYSATLQGHAQGGAFFTTDTMMPVHDSIDGVDEFLYVQKCRKSFSEEGGSQTQFTLRLPVLNPALTRQTLGGGVKTKPFTPATTAAVALQKAQG